MKSITIFAISLILSLASFATETNPKATVNEVASAKKRDDEIQKILNSVKEIRKKPGSFKGAYLNGIRIGTSSMTEAEKKYGKGIAVTTGEAGTSETSLCFFGKDSTTLVFTSDEVSQGIGSIEIYRAKRDSGRDHCTESRELSNSIATQLGIGLMSDRSAIRKKLGPANRSDKNTEVYLWEIPEGKDCINMVIFIFWFENDKMNRMEISDHTTC